MANKSGNLLGNSVRSTQEIIQSTQGMDDSFKALLNTGYVQHLKGIIDSVLLVGDTVFAVVRRDHESDKPNSFTDSLAHGDVGWFNVKPYENLSTFTLADLSIPTDITPLANVIQRYVGKPVIVTVQNNIAIFASVVLSPTPLTTVKPSIIREIRSKLTEDAGGDIFSKAAEKLWRLFGITQEEVEGLKGLIYNLEEHSSKVITFEGEGNWNKDIAAQQDGELVMKPTNIVLGLNKQGMKTNKCHEPTRIFSAK